MKLLILVLIVGVSSACAEPISDKTGLVNTLEMQSGGISYEVRMVGNFDVAGYELDIQGNKLLITITSSLEGNVGELVLPRGLLDGDPGFRLNGMEIYPDVKSSDRVLFATLEFNGTGRNELEVYGTVPLQDAPTVGQEWWPVLAVMAAAIAAVILWRTQR